MATLIVFRTACVSDPGIVSADNVDRALQIFPYDHILFTPKTCRTCGIIK